MALTLYEQGLCPGCGKPQSRAYDMDSLGEWELHTAHCNACEALEKHRDQVNSSTRADVPGDKTFVVHAPN